MRFALQKNLRTELIDHRITMALNVLSWLCDGQQKDMQDILRDEKTFSVCMCDDKNFSFIIIVGF